MDLTKHLLLEKSYDYVCLAVFSTDRLEKSFGKLRQGSGGENLINAQQVTEKLRISQAKLQLMLNSDYNITPESIKHECPGYNYSTDEVACNVFNTLPELEKDVSKEVNMSIFHITGHVIRKVDVEETNDDTIIIAKNTEITLFLSIEEDLQLQRIQSASGQSSVLLCSK